MRETICHRVSTDLKLGSEIERLRDRNERSFMHTKIDRKYKLNVL